MQATRGTLLGIALDVSDSMRTSMGGPRHTSRLAQLRDSLRGAVEEAWPARSAPAATEVGVRVFVYAVGTKIPGHEVLDVLAALRTPAPSRPEEPPCGGGFERLAELARRYECGDWVRWARKFLDDSEAGILADELSLNRRAAEELANLLPKGVVDTGLALARTAAGRLRRGSETELDRARKLVLDLIARRQGVTSEDVELRMFAERLPSAGSDAPAPDLAEASRLWDELSDGSDLGAVERYVFGRTPMCAALDEIRSRFARERVHAPDEDRLLFLLSDGEPTDGHPAAAAEMLKSSGVGVISCFVTGQDLAQPRTLYSAPDDRWTDGARLMFDMASPVPAEGVFAQYLSQRGWEIGRGARMFVQVNHPEVLDDVLRALFAIPRTRVHGTDG
jgi:hypothetical protein